MFGTWRERWREWREARSEFDHAANEMRFHVEQETKRNIERGMTPVVAHREAQRAFGGIDRFLEEARDQRSGSLLSDLSADVRYALRMLRNKPGFTAVAILTLALGIGANTALFSVVDAALLRPLPFDDPDRLVKVMLTTTEDPDLVWSYPKYEVLQSQERVFSKTAGYAPWSGSLSGVGDAERLTGEMVTADYFELLGLEPLAGRSFSSAEERDPDQSAVIVLSESLWRRRFNADQGVIGRVIRIDGKPSTVIGVAPASFRGLSGVADAFVPVSVAGRMLTGPWAHFMTVVARLDTNQSIERAHEDVVRIGQHIDREMRSPRDNGAGGADVKLLNELRVDPAIRRSVLVLFGAVTFVLLIACVNVANLLLARAVDRQREIAVRVAIGAGRSRLMRQLLTEAMVLAFVGGLAGLLLAWVGVRVFGAMAGELAGTRESAGLDAIALAKVNLSGAVLFFALLASLATGLLFGAAPALQAVRSHPITDLKSGSEAPPLVFRRRGLTARNLLVVSEIALAFVLLVGSGLMLRSLSRLLSTDAGLDATNLLTVQIALPDGTETARSLQFWQQLQSRLTTMPGVQSVSVADCPPLVGRCNVRPFWAGAVAAGAPEPVGLHYISPAYFTTLRAALINGRVFEEHDRYGGPNVVLINETAARRFFPGENPIGKRVAVGAALRDGPNFSEGAEIIGVVGDQRFASIETPAEPDVYVSFNQVPQLSGYVMVRTGSDPAALASAVRREVARLDPALPVYDVQTMEQRVANATARTRLTGLLLGVFAAVALVLALIGIYGVVAYTVTRRTRELGLRIALGAPRSEVAALILRYGAALASIGILAGLIGAWGATRVLRSLLYEVQPTDSVTFVALAAATTIIVFAASALPALKVTRLDPVIALKRTD